jgi:hypothetical protein
LTVRPVSNDTSAVNIATPLGRRWDRAGRPWMWISLLSNNGIEADALSPSLDQ